MTNPAVASSLPIARVKRIMKADRDVQLCSPDAVQLTAFATELFVEKLLRDAADSAENDRRRTITYKDLAKIVKDDPLMAFLEELIPEPVPTDIALQLYQPTAQPEIATEPCLGSEHHVTSDPSSQPDHPSPTAPQSSVADYVHMSGMSAVPEGGPGGAE